MPKVNFILPDKSVQTIEVETGMSVMRAAVEHSLPGIIGECGGSAMCGTCHVVLPEHFAGRVPGADQVEHEMLEALESDRLPGSRLSCQLIMTQELDGLTVDIPQA